MRKGSGQITRLGDLFESYRQRLRAPQKTVVTAFCEVVQDILGIAIKPEIIKYNPQNKTLAIGVGGPLKSEIKLHEAEILTHLKGRLGEKSAPLTIL